MHHFVSKHQQFYISRKISEQVRDAPKSLPESFEKAITLEAGFFA